MSIQQSYPNTNTNTNTDINELLADIGKAGQRISQIDACEGAAGNISVYAGWPVETHHYFPKMAEIDLPISVPELAGASFLVTGSGCRLRDVIDDPASNLGLVIIDPGGETAKLHTSNRPAFRRITSEFNSHLAVHRDQVSLTGTNFHAVVHAQPLHLTYLSHIARYRDQDYLNRRLLCWQPEMIVNMPRGLGIAPFLLPGSAELMQATLEKLRDHQIVIWSKHGLMARSSEAALKACDQIEYAEAAARYEYLNLCSGETADGLSPEEVRAIAAAFSVEQSLF